MSTYGVHLLLPDLTPNVGLWWYFFIEMFDSFRNFFLCVFQLHLVIYVGGVTIRLRKQPLFAIITLLGLFSIFKSYPSVGDTALYMSLLALYRHVIPRRSHPSPSSVAKAKRCSYAIFLYCYLCPSIHLPPWPCILSSVDLRWVRQCKLLLRNYAGVVPSQHRDHCGWAVCRASR